MPTPTLIARPMLLNVVRKMEENYDFSQMIQKFVPFLHNKFQNTDCYKCIANIARDAYLSEQDAAELLKAETHPQQANLNDEIIRKLNQDNKIPELPEKAFETTMRYVGKKVQMTDEQTKNLLIPMARMADTYSNEHHKLAKKVFYSMPNKDNVQYLPVKQREAVQKCQQELTASNMSQHFKTLQSNDESTVDKMVRYDDLLKKITDGHTPDATEIKEFYDLHLAVSGDTIPASMHNRPQAFLENHQTEQDLKGKFVNMPTNVQELIRALENSQQLTPFQTIYLLRYFKKHNVKLASKQALQFHTAYERIDQNLIRLAEDMDDLIDPKMLEALGRVVTQIEREENRYNETYIKLKDFGKELIQTTAPGEQRLRKLTERNDIIQAFFKEMKTGNQNYNIEDLKKLFRIHWGADVQGYVLENGNQLYYVPDSRMGDVNQIEANVIKVSDDPKQEHSIYIVEANPDKGVLITIYRHIKNLHELSVGQSKVLNGKTLLGNYQYQTTATDKKGKKQTVTTIEHGHVEKLFMPKEQAADVLGKEANGNILSLADKDKIRDMIANVENNSKKSVQNMNETRLKVVEAFDRKLDSGDKEFVIMELFTPGTQLYNHYINEITSTWIEDAEDLYKHGNFLNHDYLKSGDDKEAATKITGAIDTYQKLILLTKLTSTRNQQQLEVIAKILIQAKLLLQQIGETYQPLENMIQQTQKSAIDIREKLLSHGQEIKHIWQEILQNDSMIV